MPESPCTSAAQPTIRTSVMAYEKWPTDPLIQPAEPPYNGMETSAIVIHRDRTFTYDGRVFSVHYTGPGWGYVVRDENGEDVADGYMTKNEIRDRFPSDWASRP